MAVAVHERADTPHSQSDPAHVAPFPQTPLTNDTRSLILAAHPLIVGLERQEREKAHSLPTDDPLDPRRQHRVRATREEMLGQPDAIRRTLEEEGDATAAIGAACVKRQIDRVVMVGCGDSLASAVGVRGMYEHLLGIPCEPLQALDFAYYHHRTVSGRTLVVVLSSSGVTTRAIEALLVARERGALTLGVSNTPGSPVMTEADLSVTVHAQRRGWPTQASTAAMAALCHIGLEWARRVHGASARIDELDAALHRTPEQVEDVLARHDATMAAIADREVERAVYLLCGGGPAYACAMFGAAKVKECVPSHAIALPLEEYHHYSTQRPGDPLFLVAPRGPSLARASNTALRGQRSGGQVYAVATEGCSALSDLVDVQLELPGVPEVLVPIVYTVPLQLFAYHASVAKLRRAEKGVSS